MVETSIKINKNKAMINKWIKFNLYGMAFKLKVFGYDKDNEWAKTSWSFKFEDIISYDRDYEEIFTIDCIDYLISYLKKLLNNKIKKIKKVGFFEPDFEFVLKPQEVWYDPVLKDDPPRVIDICMELNVYLWHKGATPTYFSMTFERKDIQRLYDYLVVVSENGRRVIKKEKYTNFDTKCKK